MKKETIKAIKSIAKDKCCNPDCNEKATALSDTFPYCQRCYNRIKPRRKAYRMSKSMVYL